MAVQFINQEVTVDLSGIKREIVRWIYSAIEEESKIPGNMTVFFCTDAYILEVNRQYLAHDYYTDIITFDYTERKTISGDLVISVDTVRANATRYGEMFHVELMRVVIHGILHLIGYKDKRPAEKREMRAKESYYLKKLPTGLLEKMRKKVK